MDYIISPSILSADLSALGEDIKQIDQSQAQWIHIDIMDGNFVPNISFGFPLIRSIRGLSKKVFDVHLMIQEPGRYVKEFIDAGADMLTVHAEACTHLHRVIQNIKSLGARAGVSLNPSTPLCVLDYILPDLDMVLLMSVNPGYGGQTYIEETDRKIKELKTMIDQRGLDVDIQVDGGVTADNIGRLKQCGANNFVAGSAVFHGDINENINTLFHALEEK